MILLPTQLQSLAFMMFMGWVYGLAYSFVNRLFYALRKKRVIYVIEILFHIVFMSLLFYGLFRIYYGVMNLYLWLAFAFGLYVYLRCYSLMFLRCFESFMAIVRRILKPLRIAYSRLFGIIRRYKNKRRSRKNDKKRRHKQKKEKVK